MSDSYASMGFQIDGLHMGVWQARHATQEWQNLTFTHSVLPELSVTDIAVGTKLGLDSENTITLGAELNIDSVAIPTELSIAQVTVLPELSISGVE